MHFFHNPWGSALLAAAHPPAFPEPHALSVSGTACTATVIALPEIHLGPTATVFARTQTAVRPVDCGACVAVTTSELPLGVLPAVHYRATVTADAPATVTSYVCAERGARARGPGVQLKGPMRFLVPVPVQVPVSEEPAGVGGARPLRGRDLDGLSIETAEDGDEDWDEDQDDVEWESSPELPSGPEPGEDADAADCAQSTADAPSGLTTLTLARATRTKPPESKTKSKGKTKAKTKTRTKEHAPHATPSPHPDSSSNPPGAWWSAPPATPHTISPAGAPSPPSCTKSLTLAPALPRPTLTVYPATVTHTSRWDCGGCAVVYSTLRLTPTAPVSFVKTKTARKPSVVTELRCTDRPRPPKPTDPEKMGWGPEFGQVPAARAVRGGGRNDPVDVVDEGELERLRALGFHVL